MATVYYPAVIDAAKEGFGVYFPDLPGCVSHGATQQEAARMAEEALNAHLALMVESKEEVPSPSDLDAIERDPEVTEVARMLVRGDLPGQIARVNVTMDEALLKRIDAAAQEQGFTRSGFLAEGARRLIELGRAAKARDRGELVRPAFGTAGFKEDGGPYNIGARARKKVKAKR